MRIGILTFHRSINYGAYMQSFSLSHEIKKRFPSTEVELVDYNSLIMENNYKVRFNKSMLRTPKEYFCKKDRKAVFLDSLKHLPLSPETIFDDGCEKVFGYIKDRYDIIITGSDAVFNWVKRGFPNPYLLGIEGITKLSYAASASNMPMKHVTPKRREEFGRYLKEYDFISVRDSYTYDLVKHCSGLDAYTVCDPTAFLDLEYVKEKAGITTEELKEKIYKKYKIPKDKRLIGFMGTNRELVRKVREKYKNTHCVVSMFGCSGEEDVYIPDINPLEWSLIFSLFDITFSSFFHGLMLSFRNNTPCIGIDLTPFANNYKNKIEDILCRMGFDDCFFTLSEARYNHFDRVIEKANELMSRDDIPSVIENNLRSFASSSDVFFNRLGELIGKPNTPIEKRDFINPKNGFVPNNTYTCTGCSLCEKKCPKGAISMSPDRGFYIPVIDSSKCIKCGICNTVCPLNKEKIKAEPLEIYAAAVKDNELLMSSSSGGAFGVIAEKIIENGGVVSGVAFDSEMKAVHKIARTKEELTAFHGSKYVQADMGNIYAELENELKTGKTVLASGTPCQIYALREYFGGKYDNLILLDIICTGVQSPEMFKGYIEELEAKYKKKITDFSFRDKTNGWKKKTIRVTFEDGSVVRFPSEECGYYDMFYVLRTSCYRCAFKGFNDVADITLGDYWGMETLTDKFDMKKGISVVLLKTEKGRNIFGEISDRFIIEKSNYDHAVKTHKKLIASEIMPKYRDAVCEALSDGGYKKAKKTYYSKSRLYRLKTKILH